MAQHCVKLLPWRKSNIAFEFTRKIASASTSTNIASAEEQIIIPKRIPRDKTDILRALSATVGIDPTAPHYKYIDDPFLIPRNKHAKMLYALSKESGKKAAKYFMAKYPELFMRDESEPKIEAFHWKELLDESMELNEDDLKLAIERNQVENAITAFNTITKNNGELSDSTKQDLLELVSYFNSIEAPDPDLREKFSSERPEKLLWSDDFPFTVFESINNKDSKAYSALIAGLIKNGSIERALQVYDQANQANIPLTVEGYNSLLETCEFKVQAFEGRWHEAQSIIKEMNENGVTPNLWSFMPLFEILNKSKSHPEAKKMVKSLLAEMHRLNIEPSLGIYYYLVRILVLGSNYQSRTLDEILNLIDGKKLTMRHPNDTLFFTYVMTICNNHLSDVKLAYKLHNIVSQHHNYLLLGTNDQESRYYNSFFKLLVKSETIDNIMEIYYKYVPNIYVPDTNIMVDLLEATNLYQADHYIPQICSDYLLFDYPAAPEPTSRFLEILAKFNYKDEVEKHIANTAFEIIRFLEHRLSHRKNADNSMIDASIFDHCMKIFVKSKDFAKGQKLLACYEKFKNRISGQPSFQNFRDYLEATILHGGTGKDIISVVKTACELGNGSVLAKALFLLKQRDTPDVLLNRLEDIREKYGINLDNYVEDNVESDNSSQSSGPGSENHPTKSE